MYKRYHDFLIRDWQPQDRDRTSKLIGTVLAEFGLDWEPAGADQDVMQVESSYLNAGGQFWVVEKQADLVGTAAFYPLPHRQRWAEIRKMYLSPHSRNQGLGQYLLELLEAQIHGAAFDAILIETSTQLPAAMRLYEKNSYQPYADVETARCDCAYIKYLK